MNSLGVINEDCTPRNVLVSCSNGKTFRPYLVDLSRAYFKSEFLDECELAISPDSDTCCNCWDCRVHGDGNPGCIGGGMQMKGKRIMQHELKITYQKTVAQIRDKNSAA
jgi:hypothetical protein